MNNPIEAITFTIAAGAGLATHLLLGSIVLTFIVTVAAAILLYQLLAHFSPTNFFENSG